MAYGWPLPLFFNFKVQGSRGFKGFKGGVLSFFLFEALLLLSITFYILLLFVTAVVVVVCCFCLCLLFGKFEVALVMLDVLS
jgi:hypothetical protein